MIGSGGVVDPHIHFLTHHTVDCVLTHKPIDRVDALTLPADTRVDDALAFFRRHDLRLAPIVDPQRSGRDAIMGIISVFDIIASVVLDPTFDDAINNPQYNHDERAERLSTLPQLSFPISVITGASAESRRLWAFSCQTKLLDICQTVSDQHLHQWIVYDKREHTYVVTLSDVANYLLAHGDEVGPILDRTIESLGLASPQTIHDVTDGETATRTTSDDHPRQLEYLTTDEIALVGFRRMQAAMSVSGSPPGYNHISALPIVQPNNLKLVGTLSSTDIRVIDKDNLQLLLLPVTEYLERALLLETERIEKRQASDRASIRHTRCSSIFFVTCTADDTLRAVMKKMVDGEVHRAWMCDSEGRVNGVVTYSDAVRAIVTASKHVIEPQSA